MMNELLLRRRGASKSLPYDAKIAYLEGTGSQYIDTGLDYFADFEVGIKLRQSVANKVLGNAQYNCLERYDAYNPYWTFSSGQSRKYMTTIPITEYHVMKWKENKIYSDGTFIADHTKDLNKPYRMCLYAVPNIIRSNMIYFCKLWEPNSGLLVRDFIPVRKNGVGYMYDKVSGQLFGNAGTGDFILGPDKLGVLPAGYTQVEYIERGANDAYIDTGYVLDFSETIELKMSVISWSGSYSRIFGNYNNENSNCTRVIRDNNNNNNLAVEYNRKAGGGGLTRVPMTLGQPFVLSLSNSEYVMDGVSYTPSGVTGNAYNSTLKILESPNTKARIYYVKIGNKRDFIPCISPNGYAGLFDLKEGWFYRSDTNNGFTAGPVV